MQFKELLQLVSGYNLKIYINGDLQDTKGVWNFYSYEEYEVARIEPMCDMTGTLSISKGVQIEPFLNVYLITHKEIYEVETGTIDEEGFEDNFVFTSFDTYEKAKEFYDNTPCESDSDYKTLFQVTLYNNEELYRVIMETKKTRS